MNKTDRDWYMNAGTKAALIQTYLKMHEVTENYNYTTAFAILNQWLVNKMERFGITAENIQELTEGTYD